MDVDRLRDHQAAFLSTVTGGPERYGGRAMGAAHDHLDVTDDDFDRVADHLDAALAAAGAGETDREEVLDVFAGYRSEIVTARVPVRRRLGTPPASDSLLGDPRRRTD